MTMRALDVKTYRGRRRSRPVGALQPLSDPEALLVEHYNSLRQDVDAYARIRSYLGQALRGRHCAARTKFDLRLGTRSPQESLTRSPASTSVRDRLPTSNLPLRYVSRAVCPIAKVNATEDSLGECAEALQRQQLDGRRRSKTGNRRGAVLTERFRNAEVTDGKGN
jgi:hypothetical protein